MEHNTDHMCDDWHYRSRSVTNWRWKCSCTRNSMEALTALDVSNFNTSNVTTVYGMFGDMNPLMHLDTSKFDTSKMIDKEYMFGGSLQ